MLIRASLFFVLATVAGSTIACSSLTKPDEIQIYAEPKPAAAPAPPAAPGRPAAGNSGG